MSTSFDPENDDRVSALRDHIFHNGPCSVREAADISGLRPGQVCALLMSGNFTTTRDLSAPGTCSICRAATEASDLCNRCRSDLQVTYEHADEEPTRAREVPAPRDPGSGMRYRRY